jgi:hypothetical protein
LVVGDGHRVADTNSSFGTSHMHMHIPVLSFFVSLLFKLKVECLAFKCMAEQESITRGNCFNEFVYTPGR